MKNILKPVLWLIAVIGTAGIYASCTKDNSPAQPVIKYVRITNPASSDSLLVGAFQGGQIAIIGENLGDATEIWFNDQKAVLTPTYITNTTILVNVPNQIPKVITNKLKIVFSDGRVLLYDFKVLISEPVLKSMDCEYVATGNEATLRGDFFYEPLTVTFTGGVKGEITSITDKILKVRIPNGALPGQVTVKTNFGEVKSDFWFRDNRNIIISSDPFTGWWNNAYVVTNPGTTESSFYQWQLYPCKTKDRCVGMDRSSGWPCKCNG
ncbi:MAG: IPT/TIG domain-containing protein [Chitinophagaceae bacterium]